MTQVDAFSELFHKAVEDTIKELEADGRHDQINRISEQMQSIYEDSTDEVSAILFNSFKEMMYANVLGERANDLEFMAHQEQKWGRCFVILEAFYYIVLDVIREYKKYIDTIEKKIIDTNQYTLYAMDLLQGRSCQVFFEIICLIKNGFADGAMARWRTLYELSVIANFILTEGEITAKAFIDYGEKCSSSYDWAKASQVFSQYKKVRFADLQKRCSFISLEQYNLANSLVHGSPDATLSRIGLGAPTDVIPVGKSDYGIHIPAENAAISLATITVIYLNLVPYGDGVVVSKIIMSWVDFLQEAFSKQSDALFKEEHSVDSSVEVQYPDE